MITGAVDLGTAIVAIVSLATIAALVNHEAQLETRAVESYNGWAARHGCDDHER
jgi:hypothetical protein